MRKKLSLGSTLKIMLFLACFVVIVFGMRAASDIITPIVIAFIISVLFIPLQRWLLDRNIPNWLTMLIVLLIILLVVSGLISISVVSITQFVNRIPQYSASLQGMVDDIVVLVESLPFEVTNFLTLESFDVSQILNVGGNLLGGVLDTVSNWGVVVLLVAFMLADFAKLPEKLEIIYKNRAEDNGIGDLMLSIRRYLTITTTTGVLVGVINAILLAAAGVDFAVLWGIFSFLMNYIPSLGIIISFVPPAVLALLEFGWQRALIVGGGFILINFVIENILKPRVMGEGLNISPLFIMLSLVLWTFVLGPIGTILAVPLTLIATKLLLESSEEMQWLSVLMTSDINHPISNKKRKSKKND